MKGAEELAEILFECGKQHNKITEWWSIHKNDDVFETEEGNKLRRCLGGMIKQETMATIELGIIELKEAEDKHPKSSENILKAHSFMKEAKEAFEAIKESGMRL